MSRLLTTFFFLLYAINSFAQTLDRAALFGEHAKHIPTQTENSLRIFMDMNGDYYPENNIADEELRWEGKAQLKYWAAKYPEKFKLVASTYQLKDTRYTPENYQILQDSIIQNITRIINREAKDKRLVWLIHGYRKRIYHDGSISSRSSYYDNQSVKKSFSQTLTKAQNEANFYIEVYWDGKYADFGFKLKNLIELGKLFKKEAIPHARMVGYSLRKIFSFLTQKEVVIVSHSAGTHIVTSLLYNTHKEDVLPTPSNEQIRVALLASASPGKKLFKNFYARNTDLPFRQKDGYAIMNVYKENDIVLRKKGFVGLYGNTSLGCNFNNASGKLKKMFAKRFPNSTFIDCAIEGDYASHQFISYVNATHFAKAIAFLFP